MPLVGTFVGLCPVDRMTESAAWPVFFRADPVHDL